MVGSEYCSQDVLSNLSAQQREIVRVAVRDGFFERPQQATAEELAQQMGLSRSTFLYHLRGAERLILENLLKSTKPTQ